MFLTVIIISLPIGIVSFFFSKKILRKLSHLLGKIDSFDALVKCKKEFMYLYTTKFPLLFSYVRKSKPKILSSHTNVDDDDVIIQHTPVPHVEEDRVMLIKRKKMLEKIIYDALGFRKEWRFEEYEKKIIEWLAIDSEDKDLNKLLADLYFTMGNYKKALPILKKIVEMDPKDHKAIWQIWEIYLTSSDFDVAELLIQKAITINPSNPKYYISMVELLYNTDRKHDAIMEMEKVIKLRPTNSAYMLTLADLYTEEWDIDNAKKYYFRVLEYEPSNEKAKKRLKELAVE